MRATDDVGVDPESRGRAGRGRFRARAALVTAAAGVLVLLGLTAPVAAAAPRTAPPPTGLQNAPQNILWEANSSPDLLAGFQRTEYNEESGPPVVVPSPDIPGRQAIQFTVPGGGTRSELLPKTPEFNNGDQMFFGYNGKLADDFPVDADRFQILMQWHHASDDGSPPVAIHVKRNQILLAGGGNNDHEGFEVPIGPAQPGQNVNLVVRIAFSKQPETSSVDVWNGGRQVITDYHPPSGTAYDEYNYLKVGLYRDSSLTSTARAFVDNVVVGTDLDSVQREVGATAAAETGGNGTATSAPDATSTPDASSSSRESTFSTSSFLLGAAVVVAVGLVMLVVSRSRSRGRR